MTFEPASRRGLAGNVCASETGSMKRTDGREFLASSDIRDAYDCWSDTYDAAPNPTIALAHKVVRRLLPARLLEGRHVLELGPGTGALTEWLVAHAGRVVAMDSSPRMLARAQERIAAPVSFVEHDIAQPWPVHGRAFELVAGALVLEHIPDLKTVFTQARRALCPAGVLQICEFHPYRQQVGKLPTFIDPKTRKKRRIPSFHHDVSDLIRAGLGAGFTLRQLDEWRDEGAEKTESPRLLSAIFEAG